MTLQQVIRILEKVALEQPAVRNVVENDVFRLNTLPDAKYGVFAWTQGQHAGNPEEYFRTFAFSLFYVDRLRVDLRNQVEVQSVAFDVLDAVLRRLSEDYGIEVGEWQFTPFNQRFLDECAGGWATVRLQVPIDDLCKPTGHPGDFNDDFSDDFWKLVL